MRSYSINGEIERALEQLRKTVKADVKSSGEIDWTGLQKTAAD